MRLLGPDKWKLAGSVLLAGLLGACSQTTYGTGVGAGAQTVKDLTGLVSFGSKDSEPIDYEPRPGIVAPPPNAALPKPGQAATPANWPKDPTATATAAGNEKVYASNRSGTKEDVLMDPGFKLPKADRIVYDDHSKDPNSAETLMREMKEQRGDAEKLFAKKNAAAGGAVDPVRERTAAQVRTVGVAYGRWHRMRVRPQLSLLLLAELVVSLVTARFAHAASLAGGWRAGRRSLKDRRQRRQLVERIRKVPDRDVRHLQVRGFARLRGEVLGRRAEDRDALAASSSGEVITSARGGSAVTAWVLAIAFLVLGSRAWLTDTIPVVGEFVRFPGDPATLFEAWTSRYREVGVGTVGPSPTANGALAAASALTLGSTSLLRQILILATLPVGAIGMWRLCRPVGSRRARVVGLFAYLATPVLVNAMAWGRWGALVVYALAPWIIAILARASRAAPFGVLGGERGPGVPDRPLGHHIIGLGIVTALAALLAPVAIVVVAGIGVAMALGGLLGGRAAGWWRLPVTAVGAALVAGVLLGPWTVGFVQRPLEQLAGASSLAGGGAPGTAVDLAALVRFDTGPVEVGIAGYGLLAAASLALLIGKGWRLVWAVRCWTLALAAWAVVWVAAQGWITPFPAPELPMAVAAAALAFATALGMAAFEVDLPDYHFGWRQVVAVVAGAGFFVFLLPALAATIDGGWRLPTSDFAATVDQLDERTDGPFRVLWVGDPAVLPLNGWTVPGTEDVPVAFGVSYDGPPSVEDLYARPGTGTDLLADALAEALDGDSSRLGAALGPMGIRYVVVPDRRGPAPGVGAAEAPRPEVLGALDDQLDLARVEGNPALVVYQNAEWSPVRALLDAEADGAWIPPDAATALRFRDGYGQFSGSIDDPATVYLAADADPGWTLDVDGATAEQTTVQGWSMLLRPSTTGDATLRYTTPPAYVGGLVAQVVAWALAILVLLRIRVVVDERRRRARTPEEELADLGAAEVDA